MSDFPESQVRLHEPDTCSFDERDWARHRARFASGRARPKERKLPESRPDQSRESVEAVYAALRKAIREFAGLVEEQRFKSLANEWRQATRFLSNVTTKVMHPAYQKIIGMGEVAVPFLLKDLVENGPTDWFWALHVITDANPVKEAIAGNMVAMTEAWIRWGRDEGYLSDSPRPTKESFQG